MSACIKEKQKKLLTYMIQIRKCEALKFRLNLEWEL
jgi:hypothetical protein